MIVVPHLVPGPTDAQRVFLLEVRDEVFVVTLPPGLLARGAAHQGFLQGNLLCAVRVRNATLKLGCHLQQDTDT